MKRKCSPAQLKALAKGRAARLKSIKARNTKRRKTTKGPKRKRKRRRRTTVMSSFTLTGGTGDVNPQFFSAQIAQVSNDSTVTNAYHSPVNRLAVKGNKKAVMEVLKIYCNFSPSVTAVTGVNTRRQVLIFGTRDYGTTAVTLAEPTSFGFAEYDWINAFTAGGSFWDVQDSFSIWDCTDGAGHGILVATDYFYVQFRTAGTGDANTAWFKILYRFKNVSLQEYIGIVQSQQ